MFQLIYASRAPGPIILSTAKAIWQMSEQRNAAVGISGVLFFNPAAFLQCLEGERNAVNELYHKIAKDPRHHDLTLLRCGEVTRRSFARWSMGFITTKEAHRELLMKYSEGATFDPQIMSGESALGFLEEAAKQLPIDKD